MSDETVDWAPLMIFAFPLGIQFGTAVYDCWKFKLQLESINSRHLALEPLCCIQSCRIRSGCYAVGTFEAIGIICIVAYSISKLIKSFEIGDYGVIESYADFADHPSSYLIIVIACVIWSVSIALLIFGVRKFHARLLKAHLVTQALSMTMCLIILVSVAVQLALRKGNDKEMHSTTPVTSADASTGPTSNRSISISNTSKHSPASTTEQIGLLTCSIYVISVQIWGVSVVYDCYKYFKLCQVLVQLGLTKRKKSTTGVANDSSAADDAAQNSSNV